MGEITTKKDTQLALGKEPHLIEISDTDKGKMDYFKTELERLSGIEKTLKGIRNNYVQAINEKAIYKDKYDKERELTNQLSTELNILKAYKTLIELTCICPNLNKKINIFDCNRGFNNFCKNKECSSRRILIEDIKNKYLD